MRWWVNLGIVCVQNLKMIQHFALDVAPADDLAWMKEEIYGVEVRGLMHSGCKKTTLSRST